MESIVFIIASIGMVGIAIWICDMNRFVVMPYEVKSKKVLRPYRFMVLSDLHGKSYGKNNRRLMKAIKKWNPDSIMIAGDMITGKLDDDFQVAIKLIEQLTEQCPVYYGLGNHESKIKNNKNVYRNKYLKYRKAIARKNLTILTNQGIHLPQFNIEVCGVEIGREYFKRYTKEKMQEGYLKELIGNANNDCLQILIAHNPDYYEDYIKWGADLVLSGHIHGGIIKIPFLGGLISPAVKLFPKFDGGLYEKNGKKMIISRGLGTHTLPVRILNPGELIAVTLLPDSK